MTSPVFTAFALQPFGVVTVRLTVYEPALLYVYEGATSVLLLPSPNIHR